MKWMLIMVNILDEEFSLIYWGDVLKELNPWETVTYDSWVILLNAKHMAEKFLIWNDDTRRAYYDNPKVIWVNKVKEIIWIKTIDYKEKTLEELRKIATALNLNITWKDKRWLSDLIDEANCKEIAEYF